MHRRGQQPIKSSITTSRRLWPQVEKQFSRQIVRVDIVRKMIECGMKVGEDMKLLVGDVGVDYSAVARAVGVDRRVVKQTLEQIRASEFLYDIFSRIEPFGASLVPVVSKLGYSAVVIEADQKAPGVMAAVATVLSRNKLVIRQALADDPDMVPDAKMTLVVEGGLLGKVISELNALKQVKSVKILK